MNQLVIMKNRQAVTSTTNVASNFEREHYDVIKSVEKLKEDVGTFSEMFFETSEPDSYNRERKVYLMNRDGFTLLAMGFTGQKATSFKLKYIEAFNEMEKQLQPKSIEDLIIMQAQSVKEIREKVENQDRQLETVNHRLDNIDKVDTIGDLQQRLNGMVRRYAQQEGVGFGVAWKGFRQSFNTAYRTNLKNRMNHYKEKHGLKSLTMPQYLSLTSNLEDAIRVADKMLNREVVQV